LFFARFLPITRKKQKIFGGTMSSKKTDESQPEAPIDSESVDELKAKNAELTAGWQRTQADFVNFKRQTEADRQRFARLACSGLIEKIVPIFDNFELAAKHIPEDLRDNNWAVGVTFIEKQLYDVLRSEGLERITSLGQPFNPELHEALEHVESDKPSEEIVEEVSSGYLLDGQVLRAAKVKVSAGPNTQSEKE